MKIIKMLEDLPCFDRTNTYGTFCNNKMNSINW